MNMYSTPNAPIPIMKRPECCGTFTYLQFMIYILTLAMVHQDIEVPETHLKKRKQTEKAREEKLAAAAAARKVRFTSDYPNTFHTLL